MFGNMALYKTMCDNQRQHETRERQYNTVADNIKTIKDNIKQYESGQGKSIHDDTREYNTKQYKTTQYINI